MPDIDYRQYSILIIESTELYRGILKKILTDIGAENIRVASTGKDAITACQKTLFDVVFCDFELGKGKTGLQVLEELRITKFIKPSCIFAMITAAVDKSIVLSCLEHKPSLFITKPFTHNELKGRLDKIFELRTYLSPIISAMDNQKYTLALLLCDKELTSQSRYASWCIKTQCELLFKLKSYDACIEACRAALSHKSHTWAHLLLGKALCATEQHDLALDTFNTLYSGQSISIESIEAFDEAAHIHVQKGESETAQALLQQATDLSGLSIPRLLTLAGLCEQNDDVIAATKVYRNVAKHAEYSIHACPDNQLNFARSLTESAARSGHVQSKIFVAEALTAINKVNKSFQDNTTRVHAGLLACQAYVSIDESEKAKQLLAKALTSYKELNDTEKNIDVKVELARTYVITGNQDKANVLMKEINQSDEFSHKLAYRIDRISEEPVSKSGKSEVININNKGITFYNTKEFNKAITYFSKALKRFPKHIGIRLNLAQALIAQLTLQGPDAKLIQQCRDDLAHLSHITPAHPQYSRLTELTDKINICQKELNIE
jgi:CheY-like chemotaxis protein